MRYIYRDLDSLLHFAICTLLFRFSHFSEQFVLSLQLNLFTIFLENFNFNLHFFFKLPKVVVESSVLI